MRTILAYTLSVICLIAGCSSSSKDDQFVKVDQLEKSSPDNPDLLSINGELFPLSVYYGVCMKNVDALRSTLDNGMLSPHFTTSAEITGSGGVMKIGVGKFGMLPGTTFKDIPASTQPRRIQLGRDHAHHFVLVSDFGAGSNLVSIVYDGTSDRAKAEAIRIANNVVPCHVSIGRARPENP